MHRAARFSSAVFEDLAGVAHHAEAAEVLGRVEPERLVRAVVDRIGDSVAIVIGDRRHTPERLYARIARHAVDRVAAGEGSAPSAVRFVLPVRWGAHRRRLVRAALTEAGMETATFITGADAAITASDGIDTAEAAVAVYDLSASRFVVAVRRGDVRAGIPLTVDGVDGVGGHDVDDAVLRHVVGSARDLFAGLVGTDPEVASAVSLLRTESIRAKESLSSVADAPIPIRLPSGQMDAILDRPCLDRLATPTVRSTVTVFRRAMRSAGIDSSELSAIVLVGGSANLQVIAPILSEEFGRPIVSDRRPEATAASGAALGALSGMGEADSAADEPSADGAPQHPSRFAGLRRGAATGSGAVRRGTIAVAAAITSLVGVQTSANGASSIDSDSHGSAG